MLPASRRVGPRQMLDTVLNPKQYMIMRPQTYPTPESGLASGKRALATLRALPYLYLRKDLSRWALREFGNHHMAFPGGT
jgi:hypothetical protein